MTEERIAQQKRVLLAMKGAWKMSPKFRLGQLLVTAMNDYAGPKPHDLSDVDDETLFAALEQFCTKVKSIEARMRKR